MKPKCFECGTEDPESFECGNSDGVEMKAHWHLLDADDGLHLVMDNGNVPEPTFAVMKDKDFNYDPKKGKLFCTVCFCKILDEMDSDADGEEWKHEG